MKVYYFSGTGNSLVIAKKFAKEFDTDAISIPSQMNSDELFIEDNIIIVFPVYFVGIPLIIKRFLEKIKNIKDITIYAVGTYGGRAAGAMKILAKYINRIGGNLSGGFLLVMPGNYIVLYNAASDKIQKKAFESCHEKIREIADYIKSGKKGIIERDLWIASYLLTTIVYGFVYKKINKMDRNFYADSNCNSCGICQKVCPVDNIILENGKPLWKNKCEQCMACIQWCPKQSIQYGKKTIDRKRYHHPDVKTIDIINKMKK